MIKDVKLLKKSKSKSKSKFKNFFDNFSLPKGVKLDINLDEEHSLKFEIGKNKSLK